MPLNILLVEDEPLLQIMACEDLLDLGHCPRCAADFDKALVALDAAADEGTVFDVLMTDIRIPGAADGWELARLVRERQPQIGVIYISGYSGEFQQIVDGGVFIKKPYRLQEIEQALAEVSGT